MNSKNSAKLLLAGLILIGVFAVGMTYLRTHQKLGKPGIVTSPILGSPRLDIYLPRTVLDYASVLVPTDPGVLRGLPQDTSFAQRLYLRPDEIEALRGPNGSLSLLHQNRYPLAMNVVLMGTDRTSIHKPQFCLRGNGWDIDFTKSSFDTVRVGGVHPYDLPVMKLMTTREIESNGTNSMVSGIYVYWFVADHELTADHYTRMKKMALHLLATGELQRWAYVSVLGVCEPGHEDATYERMKQLIAAAAPRFQLVSDMNVASAPGQGMPR